MNRVDTKSGRTLDHWEAEIVSAEITAAMCIVSAVENLMYPGNRAGLSSEFPEFHKRLADAAQRKVDDLTVRYIFKAKAA